MNRLTVTGCGTDVGKTVVSAILVKLLQGDYWKPVECGGDGDTETMRCLVGESFIHPSGYSLSHYLSPHHAARLEGVKIEPSCLVPPTTDRPLIMETAGGILVPLTTQFLSIDLFTPWGGRWIIVSRHYVGSINHTLLTVEALKRRGVHLLGLIFNGENPDSEEAILEQSGLPLLGRLLPEPRINPQTINKWVTQWQSLVPLLTSG